METFLTCLNQKQLEAVLHTGTPLLILAGAGSGKTRVITTKIAYLVEKHMAPPQSILAVTFTNKAANEMRNRVLDLVPLAERVMIRTFHSFGAWLLRRHARLLGLNSNFLIYDDDDKKALIKKLVKKKYSAVDLKYLAGCISRAKEKLVYPGDDFGELDIDPDYQGDFIETYGLYHNKLRDIGNVDFGDLIMRPVELLRNFPEVKKRIQGRFRYILVDEFQDSNMAQLTLLKELYDGTNYLCVVGDEDQSIYKFRGAEVKNIVDFPEIFENTEVVMLEQNYRSTPNILDVAIKVVSNNHYRMGKNLWTELAAGEPVKLAFLNDQEEEAKFCVQVLQHDMKLGETAVLYRNNYQSRAFETCFQNLGIPYRIVGSLSFFQREEVKDVIAWLRLLLNPRDDISFARVVNKPSRGLGKKSMEKIYQNSTGDMIEACRRTLPLLSKKAANGLSDFLTLCKGFRQQLAGLPLTGMIQAVYTDTGLFQYYKDKDELEETAKVQNLYEMVNAASDYPPGEEGVVRFLENNTLDSGSEDPFDEQEKVTLITIHNTKGLEFDRIILTGLEDGLFPHLTDDLVDPEDDLEEERRLFYVGITRARKELFLTSCKRRRVFGTYKDRLASRFLDEIPDNLLEVLGQGRRKDEGYAPGDYVYHKEYGAGVIQEAFQNGNNLVVIVEFENGKTAQFLPKYTRLEKINY